MKPKHSSSDPTEGQKAKSPEEEEYIPPGVQKASGEQEGFTRSEPTSPSQHMPSSLASESSVSWTQPEPDILHNHQVVMSYQHVAIPPILDDIFTYMEGLVGSYRIILPPLRGRKVGVMIHNGKVCLGALLNENPFLDVSLQKQSPGLFERLLEYFKARRSRYSSKPIAALLDAREINLTEKEQRDVARLTMRLLSRVTKHHEMSSKFQVCPFKTRPHQPLVLSCCQFIQAWHNDGLSQTNLSTHVVKQTYEALLPFSSDNWLFFQGYDGLGLLETKEIHEKGVSHLKRAIALAQQLNASARFSPTHFTFANTQDMTWCMHSEGSLLSLSRIPNFQLGKALSTLSLLPSLKQRETQ